MNSHELSFELAERLAKQWEEDPCYDLPDVINDYPELEHHREYLESYQAEKKAEWEAKMKKKQTALQRERIDWKRMHISAGSSMMVVDYFAAQLLPRLWLDADDESAAAVAYDMAEAMMRERQKRYGQ